MALCGAVQGVPRWLLLAGGAASLPSLPPAPAAPHAATLPPLARLPAAGLLGDLRTLPSKEALQLRAEVAQKAAVAAGQRSSIQKMVHALAREGI